jgi:poly(3-hydroxybutyrate) depolymerase
MASFALQLFLATVWLASADDKSGTWTCEADGYYYSNGVQSEWQCETSARDAGKDLDTSTDARGTKANYGDKSGGTAVGDYVSYDNTTYNKDRTTGTDTKTSDSSTKESGSGSKDSTGSTNSTGSTKDSTSSTSSSKDGWDGTSYSKDGESTESTGDKGGQPCTTHYVPDLGLNMTRTCITHPSAPSGFTHRCWWTYVPAAFLNGSKNAIGLPLVIAMHGGGGCASHHLVGAGYKALADDTSTEAEQFVLIVPQGGLSQWGSCGSDCDVANLAEAAGGGKDIYSADDLDFLSRLISNVYHDKVAIPSSATVNEITIDPERVYMTGFSMGCMMSQRFAMEKSRILAGFGCQGGDLNMVLYEESSTTYPFFNSTEQVALTNKQANTGQNTGSMPTYITGGTADAWITSFGGGQDDFYVWGFWNGCNSTVKELVGGNSVTNSEGVAVGTGYTEYTLDNCSVVPGGTGSNPALETRMLIHTGGHHVWSPEMAKHQWNFIRKFRRGGAASYLPAKTATSYPWVATPNTTAGVITDVVPVSQQGPESAVMLADGNYLVSSINNGVGGIYKYTNGAEVTTFASGLSANTMTAGLALTGNKTTLFAAHRTGKMVTQYTVGDSGLTKVRDFNAGFEPNGLCLSEDDSKLYVAAHGWHLNTAAMSQGNDPVMKDPTGDGGGFAVITLATGDVQTIFTNNSMVSPNGCVVQGDYVYMITFQGGVASYKISDGTIVNMTSWSNNFINLQTGSPKLAGDGIAYANGKFYISLWSMMMVSGQGVAPATGSSIIECDPSGMAFCKPFSEMAAADIEIFDNKIVAPQILASKVSSIPIIEMVPAPAPKPTEAPTDAPTSAPTEAPTSAPTAAPTQAPTPAASTPTSGEQKVLLTLAITGLDYTKLNANATLKTSVENSVKTSTLASLPQGYTTDHISVTFSNGVATTATGGRRLTMSQVIADVQISPMSGSDVDALKQTVTTSKDTIGGATTSSVKTIEGVTAVMDDNASLSDLTTAASEPSTITIPITTVAPASDTSAAFGRTTFVLLPLATAAVLAH